MSSSSRSRIVKNGLFEVSESDLTHTVRLHALIARSRRSPGNPETATGLFVHSASLSRTIVWHNHSQLVKQKLAASDIPSTPKTEARARARLRLRARARARARARTRCPSRPRNALVPAPHAYASYPNRAYPLCRWRARRRCSGAMCRASAAGVG